MKLEFFFDCSSPWTYLAFEGIQPIAARHGVAIDWRPILVGGVFNAVNQEVYAARANPNPRRFAYMQKDLADWARYYGLEIGWPAVFPVNSVKAMRGCILLAPEGKLIAFARAVFEAYWGRDEDISQDDVLRGVCESVGVDAARFFEGIARADIKDALRENTDELIARGGFGSPTIFVDRTDMYFGNDRAPLIRAALESRLRKQGHARP